VNTFLAWLSTSWLGRLFLNYIKKKFVEWIMFQWTRLMNAARIKKEVAQNTAKLQDPKVDTKEEIDEAIDDALSKF
jgi:hypothetical protein